MRSTGFVAVVATVVLALAGCAGAGEPGADATASEHGWTRLSPEQLDAKLRGEDVYLVNVHVPYEGEIPNTDAFIPYTEIMSRVAELPPERSTLVLYCRSGSMSTDAARDLVAAGVTGFFELASGFNAWRAEGLPFQVASTASPG
jgi:rhodanese-related sulfurtransferase